MSSKKRRSSPPEKKHEEESDPSRHNSSSSTPHSANVRNNDNDPLDDDDEVVETMIRHGAPGPQPSQFIKRIATLLRHVSFTTRLLEHHHDGYDLKKALFECIFGDWRRLYHYAHKLPKDHRIHNLRLLNPLEQYRSVIYEGAAFIVEHIDAADKASRRKLFMDLYLLHRAMDETTGVPKCTFVLGTLALMVSQDDTGPHVVLYEKYINCLHAVMTWAPLPVRLRFTTPA